LKLINIEPLNYQAVDKLYSSIEKLSDELNLKREPKTKDDDI